MKLTFDEITHTYKLDGAIIPSVTQVLKECGFIDLSKVPQYVMEASWKFGTAVHKACELWDRGNLNVDTLSTPLIPYLEAWKKFKADYKINEFLAIEEKMVSVVWKFAGTPDRLWQPNQKFIDILDIKTSDEMYPSIAIQEAGYGILTEETHKLKIRNRWAIQLKNDTTYKVEQFKNLSDKTIFLSALNVCRWKKENIK